jgi:hypothetical protein
MKYSRYIFICFLDSKIQFFNYALKIKDEAGNHSAFFTVDAIDRTLESIYWSTG